MFDWQRQEGRFSKRLLDGGSGIKWVRDGVEVLYGQFITVVVGLTAALERRSDDSG